LAIKFFNYIENQQDEFFETRKTLLKQPFYTLFPYLRAPINFLTVNSAFCSNTKNHISSRGDTKTLNKMSVRHYELMVVFTPVLSAEEFKAATNNLSSFVTNNGGTIIAEDAWGLRSLAYPIQKKTTGLYFVMEFATENPINLKLETQMNRDESILRRMITVLDKHAVAYNDRKRKGIKVQPKSKVTDGETTVNEA
jgi:small subunit ribosomal protein S6